MRERLPPGANSPQLLTRLLEEVSRGIRTTRGLQEALSIQAQTVRAYVVAGAWLSLLEDADPIELSPLGLEYVYAGPRRPAVYARAVWTNPFAADLLVSGDGRLPDVAAVERALAVAEPELAAATLHRRASAIRSLIAPALGRSRPRHREQEERQMALPLDHSVPTDGTPKLTPSTSEYDPDAYRFVLCALLDHGELGLGAMRALLDRAGAAQMPLGGLVDLAVSRGDARRVQDTLVVTLGAVARRELASATPSVLLSDPLYRNYLADAMAATTDRRAEIRRDASAARFRPWDRRLFGHALRPDRVREDLEAVLLDRPLEAFPVAEPGSPAPERVAEAFLDVWERSGLPVALPPYLAQLQGGLPAVNRMLKRTMLQGETGLPDLATRPVMVHGGILHPGEPPPRSVPDLRTLRLRVLMHAPYAAVLAALLLVHRQRPDRVSVVEDKVGWAVGVAGCDPVPLLSWIDAFATSRGWLAVRRPGAGLGAAVFLASLEAVSVVTTVGRTLVIAEPLFARLGTDAEELEVSARLHPLAEAVEGWLQAE